MWDMLAYYAGERLIAGWNPLLAEKRSRKRDPLSAATREMLDPLRQQTLRSKDRGKPWTDAQIGLRVLAHPVEWHMWQRPAELLFADEALPASRCERDPVWPARPFASATIRATPTRLQERVFELLDRTP